MSDTENQSNSIDLDAALQFPAGDLPLPDPYPEYLACPHCGEPEVEIWCYQAGATCHNCGGWVKHTRPSCYGSEDCWAMRKYKRDET